MMPNRCVIEYSREGEEFEVCPECEWADLAPWQRGEVTREIARTGHGSAWKSDGVILHFYSD